MREHEKLMGDDEYTKSKINYARETQSIKEQVKLLENKEN